MAAKKKVVKTISVIGLAAVLAGALFAGRLSAKPANVTAAKAKEDASSPRYYAAGALRDPLKSFLPQASSTSPQPTPHAMSSTETGPRAVSPARPERPPLRALNIQGLLWGGPRPQAIINERVYGVGDAVADGTITSITRLGVTLDYHGTPVFFSRASNSKGQQDRQVSQGGMDGPR